MTEDQWNAMLIERHGEAIHQAVSTARVGIAGLGGLGSNVAVMLARLGVGTLHLVDFDVVEPSNLNRQQYRIADLGQPKTEALAAIIRDINPFITLITEACTVTEDNAIDLFKHDPIVCEAFDRPEAKAMLVNTLLTHATDQRVVAASGMAGYGSSNTIHTRRVGSRLYISGDETAGIEAGLGLMAPRVTLCAAHQANTILRLILGEAEA